MEKYIILPTYNEKENLENVVKEIFEQNIEDLGIVIVDDNSPDGTGQIADKLARDDFRITVIHRSNKMGLGTAYVQGFKKVMADSEAQYIFEMDADFSHSPKYLPDFLEAIKDSDLVLGSRYIMGGGVSNWGLFRRLVSLWANFLVRFILGVKIKDLTGGYKCFRRKVLEDIDLDNVESNGYNFQIEVTYKVYKHCFRIKEIPIIFEERRLGRSKFSLNIALESFRKVLKLRFTPTPKKHNII